MTKQGKICAWSRSVVLLINVFFGKIIYQRTKRDGFSFWEESQLLENMLNAGAGTNRYVLSPEYERAILKELFLRRTRQLQTAPDIGQR